MKTLHETDTLVLAQEADSVRAFGIAMMMCALSAVHGQSNAFILIERIRGAVTTGNYAFLYERADKEAKLTVPVAFITWGKLSRATEVIYTEMFRPLSPEELSSGDRLWIMDLIAPHGHAKEMQVAFGASIGKDHPKINSLRTKAGGMAGRFAQLPNLSQRMARAARKDK